MPPSVIKGGVHISLKKYMIIDLSILAFFGIVVEMLALYLTGIFLVSAIPTFCISILMIIIAITRWGYKGLIFCPIFAIAVFLSGKFLLRDESIHFYYNIEMFIALFLGMFGCSITLLWYKKYNVKETFESIGKIILLTLLNITVVLIIQEVVFLISGQGTRIVASLIYDAFGIVLTIIGMWILKSQGVMINVKEKMLKDKKEQEEELEFEKKFSDELSFQTKFDNSTPNAITDEVIESGDKDLEKKD